MGLSDFFAVSDDTTKPVSTKVNAEILINGQSLTFEIIMIHSIIKGIPGTNVYMDDILVTGPGRSRHVENIEGVLGTLQESGLMLQMEKCDFFMDSVTYLGHTIDQTGLYPTDDKIRRRPRT